MKAPIKTKIMGEIAEDMIDGTCCSECGCYFIDDENRRLVEAGKKQRSPPIYSWISCSLFRLLDRGE